MVLGVPKELMPLSYTQGPGSLIGQYTWEFIKDNENKMVDLPQNALRAECRPYSTLCAKKNTNGIPTNCCQPQNSQKFKTATVT
eukprot:2873521-Amphidinium_carterae.1